MKSKSYKLIVTAGPTREWIDPVRFISNPSTGQTGWELAWSGLYDRHFREVIFIHGACSEKYMELDGAINISVDSTNEMAQAVKESIGSKSLLFMAAAPADYTPVEFLTQKKKKEPGKNLKIEFKPTTDILKSIQGCAEQLHDFYRVGFAAETQDLKKNAQIKMQTKGLDYICANKVFKSETGFGKHRNTLMVLGKDGSSKMLGPYPKKVLAKDLLKYILDNIN